MIGLAGFLGAVTLLADFLQVRPVGLHFAGRRTVGTIVEVIQNRRSVLVRVPRQVGHEIVHRRLGGPVLTHIIDEEAHPAMFGRKFHVVDRSLKRHVRQPRLPPDGTAGVGAPEIQLGDLAPVREILAVRRAGRGPAVTHVGPQQEIGHIADDHVVVRDRRHGRRTGMAVGQHVHVQVTVGKAFLQASGHAVGEGDVPVRKGHVLGGNSLPTERTPNFPFGVVPSPALLANAVSLCPPIARRSVEHPQVRILFQLIGYVVQELFGEIGVGVAHLDVFLTGVRLVAAAPCPVRLESEILRLRLVEPVPPISPRAVPAIRGELGELKALRPQPVSAARTAGVRGRFFGAARPRPHEPGITKQSAARADLGMVAIRKRTESDRGAIGDVSFTRPEPTDVETISQEGIDRVVSSVFLLKALQDLAPPVCDHETIRVPYIAPRDHNVIVVGRNQDLPGMLEVEVELGKQLVQNRLMAHPDGVLGNRRGFALDHPRLRAADLLDVVRQLVRGLASQWRSILEDHDRHPADALFDENEIRGRDCRKVEQPAGDG